jgi:hypothetical protein
VWIAATLGERSVSKRYATTAHIVGICSSIEAPSAPFALRLSAHLMLGVTRVFARKSEIVLADSSALMSTLQKQSAAPSSADRFQQSITLGEADSSAFNRITLPEEGKEGKRRMTASGNASRCPPGARAVVTSLAVARNWDPSSISPPSSVPWGESLGAFDVAGAMELAFPSVSLPSGEPARDGSGGGGSSVDCRASDQRAASRSTYRARPEDITIPSSQQHDPLDMCGVDGGALNYSALFDAGGQNLSPRRSPGGGGGAGSDSFLDSPPGAEAEAADAMAQDEFQNAFGTRSARHASSSGHDKPMPTAVHEVPPQDGGGGLGFPVGAQVPSPATPHGADRRAHPTDEGVSRPSAARPPKQPRRYLRAHFDQVTELSTSHVRDCLNDTSNILADSRAGERRGAKRRRVPPNEAAVAHALLSNPMMSRVVAPELCDVWDRLVARPERQAMERRRKASETADDDAAKGAGRGGKGPKAEAEAVPPGPGTQSSVGAPDPRVDSFPEDPSPQFADTPDADAGTTFPPQLPDKVPAGGSAPALGSESMEPERLRDAVFETVRLAPPLRGWTNERRLSTTDRAA